MRVPKNNNELFWTHRDGELVRRNLRREELIARKNLRELMQMGLVDEPVHIYHEINGWVSDWHKDYCMYQAKGCEIREGDHVVDLGANIGIFSSFATMKGAERVYAFEPIDSNFQLMSLNTDVEVVDKYKLAISDRDNRLIQMEFNPDSPGGSSYVLDRGLPKESVMTMTLNTLIASGLIKRIDFLKIDIEGAEIDALHGISDENLSKIRCVAMEIHRGVLGEELTKTIYDRLHSLGFSSYTVWEPDMNDIAWFKNQNIE